MLYPEQSRPPSLPLRVLSQSPLLLLVCCITCHASCYKFRVVAFCPWSNRIEHMEVTDPYSRCTTANGERTLLVDLEDPELMPAGWKDHTAPKVASWHDISVYELHIRDFRWGQQAGVGCGGVVWEQQW